MNSIWVVSYLALWLVVIFLLLAVFALARQVGLLHRRLGAPSARMENAGPGIGEWVPELKASDIFGREVTLGSERGKQTLLAFISSTCKGCDSIAPALRSICKSERNNLDVVLVSMSSDEKSNRDFIARNNLSDIPYIVSKEISVQYRIAAPPYALLIDKDRKLLAKGVVNHLEHLESLLNTANLGYSSIQAYTKANTAAIPHSVS